MFEQNERSQMQEKINNLQKIYNDLKINYKRNLDSELKSLKVNLVNPKRMRNNCLNNCKYYSQLIRLEVKTQ